MRDLITIAEDVLECAQAWESDVRLMGNVKAEEIALLAQSMIKVLSQPIKKGESG